jgi:arylsulfatase A-like enzyme
LLEVGAKVFWRSIDPTNRLYMRTKHFVWLTPLSDFLFFAGLGLILAVATRLWPRVAGWFCPRFVCFWAVLPVLIVTSAAIHPAAWVVVALGISLRLASIFEKYTCESRRWMLRTFPVLLSLVLILAGGIFGRDWLKQKREARQPLPRAGSPNVLLVVMDTVRADHLSLHGYERATSPTLESLAKRGIRFDEARATASWTLPSHASAFTGLLPHELNVNRLTPLTGSFRTLADYLGSRGYATAGFVANTVYCSYDTGLDRGFTHYEDYVLEQLMPFRTAWLVDNFLIEVSNFGFFIARHFDVGPFRPSQDSWIRDLFAVVRRKDAELINREFTTWLAERREPARPFFAFLNYYDAHAPYVLPREVEYRFGLKPRRAIDFAFLTDFWVPIDKLTLRPVYRELAKDCYDNCIAYLDQQLGELFDELHRRGVLDQTWLVITSDHGEGWGEHDLFDHGESLYRTEIRVPLLIIPPAQQRLSCVVKEPVSLRSLPATIVDLVGLAEGSPFPGHSLASLWRQGGNRAAAVVDDAISELPSPNRFNPNQGRSPAYRGPLVSLAEGDYVYIRNEGDGTEELFNEHDDPGELHNLVRDEAARSVLDGFRLRLGPRRATVGRRQP